MRLGRISAVLAISFVVICDSFIPSIYMPHRTTTVPSMSIQSSLSASDVSAETSFELYPLSYLQQLETAGRDVRVLHMVRHAEGTHNVNRQYRDPEQLDARLTELGEKQCLKFSVECRANTGMLDKVQLVVTSPLTRCIQTALLCFPTLASDSKVKFMAHAGVRETVNYICDRRRTVRELSREFARVDFSQIPHDHDEIWANYEERLGPPTAYTAHRESAELCAVAERGRLWLRWLQTRPERSVIVSSHSAFLRCFFSWGHEGGVRFAPEQKLDTRARPSTDVPVVRYPSCEMRSFVVAFETQPKPDCGR